jgi:hypothetical protein
MRALKWCFLLALCGCPADPLPPLTGGDTCTALSDGRWVFTGPAWGMGDEPMRATVEMDEEECVFAFSSFDMAMDDLPTGGALDGADVQLDGLTSYWRTCTGTAASEHHAAGTCAEDGLAWDLSLEADTDTDTDTDADTDTDTDADTDADADTDPTHCISLTQGSDWAWNGECPGMVTPCALSQTGCTLELGYGGMTMGMPYSGVIDASSVTFADDNTVHGCVGIAESPDRITGTCDGCSYTLSR